MIGIGHYRFIDLLFTCGGFSYVRPHLEYVALSSLAAMSLFTYIVATDIGFAPNPFFGYCTLACCKPKIRRAAQPGDWIVGLTPKARGNRIVYAMRVAEKMSFADYWRDSRFAQKKADIRSKDVRRRYGDNIYEPLADGGFRQHPSLHSKGFAEDAERKAHDLSGTLVLVAREFVYFGQRAPTLPQQFESIIPGRAHRSNFAPDLVCQVVEYIGSFRFGIEGDPWDWESSRVCGVPATPSRPNC